MQGNSRPIASRQTGIHPHLAAHVARHAANVFRKPVADHNRRAFESAVAAWQARGSAPLILDAGCGIGLSSRHLAHAFPDHFVLGVDQSADRLARAVDWPAPPPANFLCLRAELGDFWRLLQAAHIRLARHYLLYPNPWPKFGQLGRRWPAHPVFPTVVALGGRFECRSNWRVYVDECGAAITQLTGKVAATEPFEAALPITPFERKYRDSGQALWRCRIDLSLPPDC